MPHFLIFKYFLIANDKAINILGDVFSGVYGFHYTCIFKTIFLWFGPNIHHLKKEVYIVLDMVFILLTLFSLGQYWANKL